MRHTGCQGIGGQNMCKSSNVKATVVISNYNYGRFLGSAIESCLAQTCPCNVIVVDDASTDNSWEVALGYVKDGIKIVRLKNNSGGNARGKNVGICLSATPYITCLDSDDMLLPNSIESRLEFAPNYDFVHGWSIRIWSLEKYQNILTPEILSRPFVFRDRAKKLMREQVQWTFAIDASTVLTSRSMYEKFGLYDEEMQWTIDREMWWRWLSHDATRYVLPQYVSIYRKHEDQVTRDRTRKSPEKCGKMFRAKRELRQNISPENTLMIDQYNYQELIGDIG